MPEPAPPLNLGTEAHTLASGARLASALAARSDKPVVIYLDGELGVGKTTLVRGVLRALGFTGTIRSPTYTLLETYELSAHTLVHLDLYRLQSANEVEALALPEFLLQRHMIFVEWPERGEGALPDADVRVRIDYAGAARVLMADPLTVAGETIVQEWFR